jgi:hypothetical protein
MLDILVKPFLARMDERFGGGLDCFKGLKAKAESESSFAAAEDIAKDWSP